MKQLILLCLLFVSVSLVASNQITSEFSENNTLSKNTEGVIECNLYNVNCYCGASFTAQWCDYPWYGEFTSYFLGLCDQSCEADD